MATINNLEIELKADSSKATTAIKNLADALKKLSDNSDMSATVNNLQKLTEALSHLNAIQINKEIASGLKEIKQAIDSIDNASVNKVERLAKALGKLSTKTANKKFAGAMSATEKFYSPAVYSDRGGLPDTIRELPSVVESAQTGISNALENSNLPQEIKESFSPNEGIYGSWRELGDVVEEESQSMSEVVKVTLNPLGRALATGISRGIRTLAPDFRKLSNILKSIVAPAQQFIRSIGRIAVYRAIRSAIKAISAGIKEGVQNLAMFSKLVGELDTHNANRVMSLYTSNFLYLKNAIATAVIPVLKTLEPLVDSIINRSVDLINVLAQLMSLLSGSTTYTKAKYFYKDYADSLDKASGSAGKLNKQLAQFDELNNLTSNQGRGGSSDMDDYLKMFEDPVPLEEWIANLKNKDWFEVGRTLSEKLKESLDNIDWVSIKEKAGEIGRNIGAFINGAMNPETFKSIGTTIAEGLNTGLEFIYNLGDEIDFENIGVSLREGLKGFLETFDWGKLADTIDIWVQGLVDVIKGFLADKELWKDAFKAVKDFFGNLDFETIAIVVGAITLKKAVDFTVSIASSLMSAIVAEIGRQIALKAVTVGGLSVNGTAEVGIPASNLATTLSEVLGTAAVIAVLAGVAFMVFKKVYESDQGHGLFDTANSNATTWGTSKSILAPKPAGMPDYVWNSLYTEQKLIDNLPDRLDPAPYKKLGNLVVDGIGEGIEEREIEEKSFKSVRERIIDGFKKIFQINSPAKVMYPIGSGIVEGIVGGFSLVDFATKMQEWWNTNVVPWFTRDKWTTIADTIKTSITGKWNETVSLWKTNISAWWTNSVAPWFTKDRWTGIATNIKTAITEKWNETVTNWRASISNWWNNNVAPWFTYDRWAGIAVNLKTAIIDKWNALKEWLNGKFGISAIVDSAKSILSYNAFFEIGSGVAKALWDTIEEAINALKGKWEELKNSMENGISAPIKTEVNTSVETIATTGVSLITTSQEVGKATAKTITEEVKKSTAGYTASRAGIPSYVKFANGGYVTPSTGSLFVAGEAGAELVGNFNGRTGVANNDQITDAMYSATYDAMSRALSENGIGVTIEGDADGMFRVIRKKASDYTRLTGNPAF